MKKKTKPTKVSVPASTLKKKEKPGKEIPAKAPVLTKPSKPIKGLEKLGVTAKSPQSSSKSGTARSESGRSGRGNGSLETRKLCRVIGCLLPGTTGGYSRNCYIKYWKQIKKKDEILKEGTLQRYIGEIVDKYPEKVVMAIRIDLSEDEGYAQMIRELDLYGGVDELEHEFAVANEDLQEEAVDDIKRDFTKSDEDF